MRYEHLCGDYNANGTDPDMAPRPPYWRCLTGPPWPPTLQKRHPIPSARCWYDKPLTVDALAAGASPSLLAGLGGFSLPVADPDTGTPGGTVPPAGRFLPERW